MSLNKAKIFILLILFIFVINIEIPVHASMLEDIWKQGSKFLKMGQESDTPTFNGQNMKDATDDLYTLFWWAGVAIALIVGAFLGIKFMTESVEGKAKIKEALIPFVLGCVIIFGAFSIWKVAINLFSDMEKAESKAVGTQPDKNEECSHPSWIQNAESHQCPSCGYFEAHTDMNTGRCSKCGKKCDKHIYKYDGSRYVKCSECGYKIEICTYMKKGYHHYVTDHATGETYCTKCHYKP